MSAPTIDRTTALPAILPVLDPAVLEEVADEILLSATKASKVAKVRQGHARTGGPVTDPRAWSMRGAVD